MPKILIRKLRLRRKRSGGSATVPPPAFYYVATPQLTAGQDDPEPVTPVLSVPAPPTGTTIFPPLDPNQTPFLGSEWFGFPKNLGVPFPDNLGVPFPDLFWRLIRTRPFRRSTEPETWPLA